MMKISACIGCNFPTFQHKTTYHPVDEKQNHPTTCTTSASIDAEMKSSHPTAPMVRWRACVSESTVLVCFSLRVTSRTHGGNP